MAALGAMLVVLLSSVLVFLKRPGHSLRRICEDLCSPFFDFESVGVRYTSTLT